MELRYGNGVLQFELPKDNLLGELKPNPLPDEAPETILKKAWMNPVGFPRLTNLLHKNRPSDVVIIVSDITRAIASYAQILKFLVGEVIDAGIDEKNIEFIIALGNHRRHTEEENNLLYGEILKDFRFSFHNCHKELISIGKTSTDNEVFVNRRAYEADFVITTGRVNFHYFAGYSGGRKSILPGIAGYQTIRTNHAKLKRPGVWVGRLDGNIIAQEMAEAASLLGIDYSLNVIETHNRRLSQVFCGHPEACFWEAKKFYETFNILKINKKADCAIVSAGGYPKDKYFYESHKLLNFATSCIKPGGSIILIAECREGFKNEEFSDYLLKYSINELLAFPEEKIEVGGHGAFVTAKILNDYNVYVVSSLPKEILSKMGFQPVENIKEAIEQVKRNHGEDFKTYIIDGFQILAVANKKRIC